MARHRDLSVPSSVPVQTRWKFRKSQRPIADSPHKHGGPYQLTLDGQAQYEAHEMDAALLRLVIDVEANRNMAILFVGYTHGAGEWVNIPSEFTISRRGTVRELRNRALRIAKQWVNKHARNIRIILEEERVLGSGL